MRTTIQKWGNSLALRIPKSIASLSNLSEDSEVDLSISRRSVVITPVRRRRTKRVMPKYSLDVLLKKVNSQNLHASIETGRAVGKEAW